MILHIDKHIRYKCHQKTCFYKSHCRYGRTWGSDKKDACPDTPGTKEKEDIPWVIPPSEALRYDRDNDDYFMATSLIRQGAWKRKVVLFLWRKLLLQKKCEFVPRNLHAQSKNANGQVNIENEASARNPNRDADHDGVKNGIDKCPFTKGEAKHNEALFFRLQKKKIFLR